MINYELGFYNFLFPEEIQDPFLAPVCMGIESRESSDYYFDNAERCIDSYLFQYTIEGTGAFETEDEIYEMSPGRAFFIHLPSPVKYYFPKGDVREPWKFIFIMIQGEHVKRYYDLLTEKTGNVLTFSEKSRPIQTLMGLYEQTGSGQLFHPFYASELTYRFLCQLCQSEIHSRAKYSARTQSVIHMMESRYADIDSIEEIADLLHVSPNHLTREFTRETGTAPIRYLTNIRLSQAASLLRETALPVAQIALACGFSSSNYFTKVFRKHMHTTPQLFRSEWQ